MRGASMTEAPRCTTGRIADVDGCDQGRPRLRGRRLVLWSRRRSAGDVAPLIAVTLAAAAAAGGVTDADEIQITDERAGCCSLAGGSGAVARARASGSSRDHTGTRRGRDSATTSAWTLAYLSQIGSAIGAIYMPIEW
jgi:hypothetical protein